MLKPVAKNIYNIIVLMFALLISLKSLSQTIMVSGFVKDIESGEVLSNAHIVDVFSNKVVITNAYGYFNIAVKKPFVNISVSYVGFVPKTMHFSSTSDTVLVINLESNNSINEIEVLAQPKSLHTIKHSLGNVFFTGKELELIPGLMGEKDILKSLQLMPGIQKGRDGTSGIFVRGGSRGQNLMLLDGVPVYNVNHLLGVFSVFTPEAVKNVNVYKGGFPARYAGRLSSVIDVRLKEGNLFDTKADITIGTIAAKFLVEGPIRQGKSSYIVSARRTYADLFFTPLNSMLEYNDMGTSIKTWSGYYFYDLIAKANFILSKTSRIYLSAYIGNDNFYIKEKESKQRKIPGEKSYLENVDYKTDFTNQWGNITTSLRWNKIITQKFFANTTLTYSSYKYKYGFDYISDEESVYDTVHTVFRSYNYSGINNYGAVFDFDYYFLPNYSIKFGAKALFNFYLPGKHTEKFSSSGDISTNKQMFAEKINTNEFYVYIENQLQITDWLSVNIGSNGLYYKSYGLNYFSIQPRLLANVILSRNLSVKLGYSKMVQPLHLLVNNSASYPVDIWVPAIKELKPSVSQQTEFGIYYTFKRMWEFSSEIYLKTMEGVINYRNGESFFNLDNSWYDKVTSGTGNAYGLELFMKKKKGKATGWIGYNLSWAFRKFNELNNGKAFPFRYDIRNKFNIVFAYKLRKNIDLSMSWVLSTGAPITISETAYNGEEIYKKGEFYGALEDYYSDDIPTRSPEKAIYYSGLNNYRLPNYHRMDVGVDFVKQKKYGERIWNISIYNLYNQNNPFFITYRKSLDKGRVSGGYKNFSLFGILPSVSYRIKIK